MSVANAARTELGYYLVPTVQPIDFLTQAIKAYPELKVMEVFLHTTRSQTCQVCNGVGHRYKYSRDSHVDCDTLVALRAKARTRNLEALFNRCLKTSFKIQELQLKAAQRRVMGKKIVPLKHCSVDTNT